MIFYKLLLNSGISIPENAITYTAPSKLDIPKNTSGISKHSFSKGVGIIIPTTSTLPGVFAGTNVTSVGVPANITSVPKERFKGCSELQSFTGPYATEDGTMFIIDNKIMGVASKSGVEFTIPASVTSIENYAFEGCSGTLRILCGKVPGGTSETNCPTKSGWLYGANFSKVDLAASGGISIGAYTFFGMTTLKEIVVSGAPLISYNFGEGSFGNCTGLTTVNIPPAILSIGISGAFYGCTNIKEFTGKYATEDGKYVISEGKLQAAVIADTHVIPNSVTAIGRSLFRNDVITEITLPEGLETIAEYAFYNSKIGSINIPSTLGYIGSNTFGTVDVVNIASIDQWLSMDSYPFNMVSDTGNVTCNGEPITHLEFPEGTTSVKNYVARNFRDLVSVTLPDGVTSIGDYSFYECEKLEIINLPENSSITIGDYAFAKCSKLGSQLIFDSVRFGRQSFHGCDSLSSVHFKRSVAFDYNVFAGCDNINVVLDATFSQYYPFTPFSGAGKEIVVNKNVPDAARDTYSILYGSSFTKLTIGPNVTKIGNNFLFRSSIEEIHVSSIETWLNMTIGENNSLNGKTLNVNGQPIETLTIPDTINIIRESAFRSCSNIKSVSFGQNITDVGAYAFYQCYSIKDIYIKDLTKWCLISFGNADWGPGYSYNIHLNGSLLEDLVVPIDIVRVNAYSFYNANLKSITIPSSVTIIGAQAFYGCKTVEEVAIPSSVTSFGARAFGHCGGVATIECNIPNYTSSTSSPFYGTNFSSIIIGNNVAQIGDNSFQQSNSLEILYIGDSVTYIGTRAFYGSYKLHTVTIGKSVSLISGMAFSNTAIKTVYCKATTPPEILDGSLLMYGKEDLKVYVPSESLDLYKTSNGWSSYKDYIFGYNFE